MNKTQKRALQLLRKRTRFTNAGIDLDNLVLNLALRGLKLERLDHADAPGYAIRITRAD